VVDCPELVGILRIAEMAWHQPRDAIAVALGAYKEGLGRVAISKLTGLTERRVRRVRAALDARRGEISELLAPLSFARWRYGRGAGVAVYPLSERLLRLVESRVVYFRDLVVISVGVPGALEVVGVKLPEGARVPGLPEGLARRYIETPPMREAPDFSLVAIWSSYRELLAEASLLKALGELCERASEGGPEPSE